MRNGFSAELARRRIAVGCNWMSLPGLEYTMNDLVKVNMAKVFEVAYDELQASGAVPSTELLWRGFERHLGIAVHTAAEGIRHHLKYQKYNEPELLLNLLSHGPLEKGRDASDGGAQYYNLSIDGAGLAVVADSFAALEQRIEREGRLTWEEVARHLRQDFEGDGGVAVRKLLQSSPRYGQENSLGESWALRVRDAFVSAVRRETEPGRVFIPGFFSWANTVGFGLSVGATPQRPQGRNTYFPRREPVARFCARRCVALAGDLYRADSARLRQYGPDAVGDRPLAGPPRQCGADRSYSPGPLQNGRNAGECERHGQADRACRT